MLTVLLGWLGLVQIAALPGWIWLRSSRTPAVNWIEAATFAFGASLVANQLLVWVLVAAGLHHQGMWLFILAVETVWLARVAGPAAWVSLWPAGSRYLTPAGGAGLAAVACLGALVIANWGSVYVLNDEVLSWDRWAMDWHRNRLPVGPDFYPQLLPANWSVTYAILGTSDIKMFGKAIMPLFPFGTVLLFVSLAWRLRDRSYHWGAGLTALLLLTGVGPAMLQSGSGDGACAFFAFLAFYVLYLASPGGPAASSGALALLFASGAALAKQGGLVVLIAVACYLLYRRWAAWRAVTAAVAVGSVAAWYGYRVYELVTGRAVTNLAALLTTAHGGRGMLERLQESVAMLARAGGQGGTPLVLFLAACLALALLFRRTRPLTFFLVIPAFLFWALSFSYELRTGALWMPFLGLVCGLAAGEALETLARRLPQSWRDRAELPWLSGALLAAAVFLLDGLASRGAQLDPLHRIPLLASAALALLWPHLRSPAWKVRFPAAFVWGLTAAAAAGVIGSPGNALLERQLAARRNGVGIPQANQRLYELLANGQVRQPVVAGYWFLEFLPGWKDYYRHLACGPECDLERVLAEIRRYPEAPFLLIEDARLSAAVSARVGFCRGLQLMMEASGVRLFQLNRAELATSAGECRGLPAEIEKLYPDATDAGVDFRVLSNNQSAVGVACRNATPRHVIVFAGERLVTAFGSSREMSASIPRRLYQKPGRYPVELLDLDTGARSSPVYFQVNAAAGRP